MVEKNADTGFVADQKQYIKDARQLIQRCTKPDRKGTYSKRKKEKKKENSKEKEIKESYC